MKQRIVYQVEDQDPAELSLKLVDLVFQQLQGAILPIEMGEGRVKPAPGIRSLRAIRENRFTFEDIQTMASFVRVLFSRRAQEVRKLVEERDTGHRDAMSIKAYDHIIGSIQSGVADLSRRLDAFLESFEETRLQA